MNRIASRAWVAMVFVMILVAGMIFFLFEFNDNAQDWVLFSGSPHVYSGNKIKNGTLRVILITTSITLYTGAFGLIPSLSVRRSFIVASARLRTNNSSNASLWRALDKES